MKTLLTLNTLELPVHLGWPQAERIEKQIVLIDISVQPSSASRACFTDDLGDTVCYDSLITKIKQIAERPFRLIEYFTQEVFQLVKKEFNNDALIAICVTKHPPISGLTGGVSFTCSDILGK